MEIPAGTYRESASAFFAAHEAHSFKGAWKECNCFCFSTGKMEAPTKISGYLEKKGSLVSLHFNFFLLALLSDPLIRRR